MPLMHGSCSLDLQQGDGPSPVANQLTASTTHYLYHFYLTVAEKTEIHYITEKFTSSIKLDILIIKLHYSYSEITQLHR